jgi:hypothetical protein
MKEILLVSIIIFGIYLYITIDQHSKDQLKTATLDIPNKIEFLIARVK